MNYQTLINNIIAVQKRLTEAEHKFNRPPGSVKLLAVSKGHPVEKMQQALQAGLTCFGENYVQEAIEKITIIGKEKAEWHFIGAIQSNKTKSIAENFHWVHSVCRYKIAERLSNQRPKHLPPLNICIEVNISNETSKSGVAISDIRELALAITKLPRLQLRGLMTIPAKVEDTTQQLFAYHQMNHIYQMLQNQGLALDTLSMGMSEDFEAAIAEASTIVRIGTAIFGERS